MSSSSPAERRNHRTWLRRFARTQAMLGIPLIAVLFVLHLGLSQVSERLIQAQFHFYQANSVLQKSALGMVQARRAVEIADGSRDPEMMYHAWDLLQANLALLKDGVWHPPGMPVDEHAIDVTPQIHAIEAISDHVRAAADDVAAGKPRPDLRAVADRLDVLYITFRELQSRHERQVFEVYTRLAVQQTRYEWAVRATLALLVLMYGALSWLYVSQRQTLADLRLARDAAERATRAKSDFLAVMSHEIRTPLNGVIGVADLLEQTRLDERQREYVKVIHHSGANLLHIIDDVLDFSRIEADQTPFEEAPFDLRDTVEQVAALFRPQLRDGVALRVDIGDSVPGRIVGDRTRYAQILTNLVSNALKFTHAGEVMIDVDATGRQELVIRVRDTGIGIEPSKLDAIYQPFAQADSSIVRAYGGTGLGLAITRRLIEMMHGDITVRSVPGQGTEFMIHLPLRLPVAEEVPVDTENARAAHARSLHVLIVEDNLVNQMVTRRLLESLGHQADVAADGNEGVQAARVGDYDLVLMDLQMPNLSGLDASRLIREQQPALPIVAVSANALPEHRTSARDAGMNGFLAKPVRLADLKKLLDELFPPGAGHLPQTK